MQSAKMTKTKKVVFLGDTIIGPEPLGIQRYTVEILKELDRIETPYKTEVLIPGTEDCHLQFSNINIVKYGEKGRKGFLWRQLDFPRYVKQENAFSVDLTLGLTVRGSDIVCLHDCIYEKYPDDFIGIVSQLKRLSYLFRARRNVKKARRIITVSKTSQKELMEYYKLPEGKTAVIYNAWQHMNEIEADDTVFEKLGLARESYFFSLGSILPHKNFRWIIEAAGQNPQRTFVVTGHDSYGGINGDQNVKNLVFTGFLSDGEIKALYQHCICFIFPSLYEGFGIPPLEALACGAEILISDKSCLPEIYGDSAVYFDPTQYTDINMSVFPTEKTRPDALKKYSWAESASRLDSILREIMEAS